MDFIKGMDVSTLLEETDCGARYYDNNIEGDLLSILKKYGCNSVRLRLWNDPYSETGEPYSAGTSDLNKTIILSRRAKALGLSILLDLHYSDFWADPGKQFVPKAWRGLDEEGLEKAVYEYTKDVLNSLIAHDAAPDLIQIGNEITNGMLWPTGQKPNWKWLTRYINAGIRASREMLPDMPVMIHLDNGGFNDMYVDWFENYFKEGLDFDIIGFSYYPFWHGTLDQLEFNMKDMARRYGKKLVVAEVSMGHSMKDYRSYEGLNSETGKGMATKEELVAKIEYPMTPEGQADFMADFLNRMKRIGASGFYYWEPGWVPVPGCGWASDAALAYTGEKGPGGNEWANQALFDYDGNALPALSVIRDFK